MDVYVDESGDLGFSKDSTKFFIVGYIACDNSFAIKTQMKRALKRLHERKRYSFAHNELKFSRMDDYCRRYVLEKIAGLNSRMGIVVVEKKHVLPKLRTDLTVLYNWIVVHNIMSALLPLIEAGQKMRVVFDKSLSKKRIESFNYYISEKTSYLFYEKGGKLPANSLSSHHIDSELEPCLQAVDAVAGAYFHMYEQMDGVYVDIIKDRISSFTYLWRK